MQTPAGYAINEVGQFVPVDWWAIIFNPSFPYRLVHMVLAAYLTTAFVVGAVGAWHLLRDRTNPRARLMFSMAMWMAALVTPIQIVAGDLHGLNTLEHQPAKVMAMEGHYESHPDGAPLILFGLPNAAAEACRLRGRDPETLQPDPETRSERAAGRARYHPRSRPTPGRHRVLVVPDHGRHSALRCSVSGYGASGRGGVAPSSMRPGYTAPPW